MEHLIPIFGIIFVIGPIASLVFSYTPLGKAVIERLRGRPHGSEDSLLQLQDEIDRLHEQVTDQDRRFEELHERLDFAERLLTSRSEAEDEPDEVVTPV
ncbi:MAG: hypothetical protein V3R71_05695 [Gemmatimonadales bacterium]|jgi:predicted nuclease with TOPRIM domain